MHHQRRQPLDVVRSDDVGPMKTVALQSRNGFEKVAEPPLLLRNGPVPPRVRRLLD